MLLEHFNFDLFRRSRGSCVLRAAHIAVGKADVAQFGGSVCHSELIPTESRAISVLQSNHFRSLLMQLFALHSVTSSNQCLSLCACPFIVIADALFFREEASQRYSLRHTARTSDVRAIFLIFGRRCLSRSARRRPYSNTWLALLVCRVSARCGAYCTSGALRVYCLAIWAPSNTSTL